MRIPRLLTVFGLILAGAVLVAWIGATASYRAVFVYEKNFSYLKHGLEILKTLEEGENPDLKPLRAELVEGRSNANWCQTHLPSLARAIIDSMSTNRTISEVCREALALSQGAIDTLDQLQLARASPSATREEITALEQRLLTSGREIRDMSLRIQPQAERFTALVERGVYTSIAGFALGLAFLYALLARHVMRTWRLGEDRRHDVELLSNRLQIALDATSEGLALFDADHRILACNDPYRESSHPDPSVVQPGRTLREIRDSAIALGHYQRPPLLSTTLNHDPQTSEEMQFEEFLELSGDRHVRLRVIGTGGGDIMVTRTDITEFVRNERRLADHARTLESAKEEVELASLTDPLTGLPNRRRLDHELADRRGEPPAPLIRIDLDRFKQVNDVLGHEAGDFVLKTVADIMRKHTRDDDVPARIGGDEFVIACAPGTTLWGAQQMAERLLEDILKPVSFGSKRCVYGASFGIALAQSASAGKNDSEDVLRDADFALYRAKQSGRGQVVLFTPELRRQANRDRALADGFVEALSKGQIVPYFQTQHEAKSWAVSGVEVLARWNHPEEGVLPPPRFLDIVRQMGMEAELDASIFASALAAVKQMREAGLTVPSASFNVSAARIIDPSFLPTLRDVPREERPRIHFEILESVSVENMGETLRFAIAGIKDLGYRIEVDDFGSGHASISALFDIQPDALKIDRNLIAPLGTSERADTMVAATIELARSTGVEVIAEGVDSPQKARILAARGCHYLQGYYFSKPMPAADLGVFLKEQSQDPKARPKNKRDHTQ